MLYLLGVFRARSRRWLCSRLAGSLFGIVLTLTGTLFFSVLYVVNEVRATVQEVALMASNRIAAVAAEALGASDAAQTLCAHRLVHVAVHGSVLGGIHGPELGPVNDEAGGGGEGELGGGRDHALGIGAG